MPAATLPRVPAAAIAVIGSGGSAVDPDLLDIAEAVGVGIADAGITLVCGGLDGVMAAASRGARGAGGTVIGMLPGSDRATANADVTVAVPTGLGEMRNALVVRAADAVIAVGGGYGTLSEIGFALKTGRPVVGVQTWELRSGGRTDRGIVAVTSAAEAVAAALAAVGMAPPAGG